MLNGFHMFDNGEQLLHTLSFIAYVSHYLNLNKTMEVSTFANFAKIDLDKIREINIQLDKDIAQIKELNDQSDELNIQLDKDISQIKELNADDLIKEPIMELEDAK